MADPEVFLSGADAWEQGNYPLAFYLGEEGIRSKNDSVPSFHIREAGLRSQSYRESQILLDALKDRLYYFQDFDRVEPLFFSLQKRVPLCKQTKVLQTFYQSVSSRFQALRRFDPEKDDWLEIQRICRQILAYFPLQSQSQEILRLAEKAMELGAFLESLHVLKNDAANAINDDDLFLVPARIVSALPPPHPFLQSRIDRIKTLQEEILQAILHRMLYEVEEDQQKGLYEQAENRMENMLTALQKAGWTPAAELLAERNKVRERKEQFAALWNLAQQAEKEHRFQECAVHLSQLIAMAPKHTASHDAQNRAGDKLKQAQAFRQECERLKAEKDRDALRSRLLRDGAPLLPADEYKTWLAWAEEGKREKRRRRIAFGVLFLLASCGVTVFYYQVVRPVWEQVSNAIQTPDADLTEREESSHTESNFDAVRLEPPKEIAAGGALRVYLDRAKAGKDVIMEARLLPNGTWKPESNGVVEFSNISSRYGKERTVEVRITQVDTGVYQVNSYPLSIQE